MAIVPHVLIRGVARLIAGEATRRVIQETGVGQAVDDALQPIREEVQSVLEEFGGPSIEQADRAEIEEAAQIAFDRGRITESQLEEIDTTMPVDYSEWVGIAFDVAKDRGFETSTTQAEIEAGEAPTTEAIQMFAEIWNERRSEIMASRASARRVAEQEISIR